MHFVSLARLSDRVLVLFNLLALCSFTPPVSMMPLLLDSVLYLQYISSYVLVVGSVVWKSNWTHPLARICPSSRAHPIRPPPKSPLCLPEVSEDTSWLESDTFEETPLRYPFLTATEYFWTSRSLA